MATITISAETPIKVTHNTTVNQSLINDQNNQQEEEVEEEITEDIMDELQKVREQWTAALAAKQLAEKRQQNLFNAARDSSNKLLKTQEISPPILINKKDNNVSIVVDTIDHVIVNENQVEEQQVVKEQQQQVGEQQQQQQDISMAYNSPAIIKKNNMSNRKVTPKLITPQINTKNLAPVPIFSNTPVDIKKMILLNHP